MAARPETQRLTLVEEVPPSRIGTQAAIGITVLVTALAGLVLIAYLLIALQWVNTPFMGLLFGSPDLVVEDASSFSSDKWAGLASNVIAGDQLIGMNKEVWGSDDPDDALHKALEPYKVGDSVELIFSPAANSRAAFRCDRFESVDQQPLCYVNITLQRMPLLDFFFYFGVNYLSALVIFGIGGFVLWRRYELRSARLFSLSAAFLSLIMAGQFDVNSSFVFSSLWLWFHLAFAASLAALALSFPFDLAFVRQVPALRYSPFAVAALIGAYIQVNFVDSKFIYFFSWVVSIQVLSVLLMGGVMLWRHMESKSPLIREQVTFVGFGTIIAFVPTFIWVGYFLSTNGTSILNEITPVARLSLILYALSVSYSVLQYSLLETDRIIPEFIVYGVLTGLLVVGYTAFSVGVAQLGLDFLDTTSPILVALTIGAIVLFFNPIRSYLRQRIDNMLFRQRRSYQERSERFARAMTNAANMPDVFLRIKRELDETVSPNEVFLFTLNSKLKSFAALPPPNESKPATDVIFNVESGLVKYLSQEQSVLYLESGQPLPLMVAPDRTRLGILGTPLLMSLRSQGRLNGILAIGHRRNGASYSYEDLRYIENLVDQATLSVERAKFVDDLQQRVVIQSAMSQISQALNFAIDFDVLVELIYAQTGRVIDADHFYLVSYDPSTDELYHSFYSIGEDRAYHLENHYWRAEQDVISEVVKQQKSLRLDHFSQEQKQRNPRYETEKPPLHAWMGVPLISDRGGILGMMGVASSDPSVSYTDEQLQILRDIANVAASAMDKTRLFQQIGKRATQLKVLNDIVSELTSQLEVDVLLEKITESAAEILGCEAGSLLLLDESTNELVFRVVTGGGGQNLLDKRISRSESSLVANAVNTKETIIVNDPQHDERWRGDIPEEESGQKDFHSRSILTVPLVAQNNAVGALQIINKRDGSPFTDDDAQIATTFAGQAAIAIQNARLFELQDQQLYDRVQELETMSTIDQSLNQTVILDQLMAIIMEIATERTGATNGALLLFTPDRTRLQLALSVNYPPESPLFMPEQGQHYLENYTGIIGQVAGSGKPLLINVSDQVPYYDETLPDCVAQMAIPIISGADDIGLLILETSEEKGFTLLEFDFASRLIDRASSAVSNAILYSRLEQQTKARADFVGFVAHELRKPLTVMKGYTNFLQRGVAGELNDQQKQFMGLVYRNVEFMDHLVGDIRDIEIFAATGKIPMTPTITRFQDILDDTLQNVESDFSGKGQNLVLSVPEDLPDIWGDKMRLIQVMTNFMTNANKYTREGGDVVVKAEVTENIWDTEGARQVVHISVKDNGLGISEEDQKKLFEQYFRSNNQEALDQKGTGLGLTLTRQLILQHGGKIWFESVLNEGTTFHFTIPTAEEMAKQII